MQEIAFMAGTDHWLCRKACSYAFIEPSKSPISSVKLPVNTQVSISDRAAYFQRVHTNMKPHLLIQRGDLLGSGERNGLLASLRRHGRHVSIDLRVCRHVRLVVGDTCGRGRLGVRHDQ